MTSKYLIHYNHNHDRLGRFASRIGGSSGTSFKDKRISKLSDKYKEQYGYTDKKAKEEATRVYKTRRNLAIAAGAAAGTAATIYGVKAYKKAGHEWADQVIHKGSEFQTLRHDPEHIKDGEAFYAAFTKKDKAQYINLFAGPQNSPLWIDENLKKKVTVTNNKRLKIAGNKNAEKVFNDLYNNNSVFKKAVDDSAAKQLYDPRRTKYENFNTFNLLNNPRINADTTPQRLFYEALSKKGYGGVADVNDRKYSGFNTNAAIIFDKAIKSDIGAGKAKIHKLTVSDVDNARKLVNDLTIKEFSRDVRSGQVAYYSILAAAGLGTGALATGPAINGPSTNKKEYEYNKKQKQFKRQQKSMML